MYLDSAIEDTGARSVTQRAAPLSQVPRECPENIVDLIHECTLQNPALRPDMKQCFDRIKARPIPSMPAVSP
jgi:hypothetical protein